MEKRKEMEFQDLLKHPLENVTPMKVEGDKDQWVLRVVGPQDTPYQGGLFKVKVVFKNWPFDIPICSFETLIYHPNVEITDGCICDVLIGAKDWKPASKLRDVFAKIVSMLKAPVLDHAHNTEADELYHKDKSAFDKKASEMTKKYAKYQ